MTFVVYDGEHLLIDKITTFTYTDKGITDHYKLNHEEGVHVHLERVSKLVGITTPTKVKSWESEILTYTTVGHQDFSWDSYMTNSEGDLKHLFESAKYWDVLNKDTTYLALEANGKLCNIRHEGGLWKAREFSAPDDGRRSCIYFGCPMDTMCEFETLFDYVPTPLEAMVIAQARYPVLGKRFDHYHFPTRKFTSDIDLSDRQRELILGKLASRLKIKGDPNAIIIGNLPKE